MAHCVAGLAIGAALAFGVWQAIAARLLDLGSPDVATLAIASSAFLASAVFAAWVPARRATRVDPVHALRFE